MVNDAGQNNSNWITRAEDFFETAHTVYEVFYNGDLTAKKRIACLVGWNAVLKDGMLTWEYNKPFNFLIDHVEEAEKELLSVGTLEFGFVDNEKASPFGETHSWRSVVDDVETWFRIEVVH